MRYFALATDYDGIIASQGCVDSATLLALNQVRESGRKLILVTGRELPELRMVFPEWQIFDRIVAENGALLVRPDSQQETVLAERPARRFVDLLRERGVAPLSIGHVIVATTEPNEGVVLQAIRQLGLELQVIFNKGAVMVLPSGVNKATGLKAALKDLGLSPHNVVGVGDAENDHAFLEYCEFSAAVGNALPALKQRADFVTTQTHGAGVRELIDRLLKSDLHGCERTHPRHDLLLGQSLAQGDVRIPPYGTRILITGEWAWLRQQWASQILKGLVQARYQFCLLDGGTDFAPPGKVISFGQGGRAPTIAPIIQALDEAQDNVVVHVGEIAPEARPPFLAELFNAVLPVARRTGRPHWVCCNEIEPLLPPRAAVDLPAAAWGGVLIATASLGSAPASWLDGINTVLATGPAASQDLEVFAAKTDRPWPSSTLLPVSPEDGVLWKSGTEELVVCRGTYSQLLAV